MRRIVAVVAAAALAVTVRSAVAAPPGFAFLEVPTGARAAGMGGAYASVATGVEAVFWNPAGLTSAHGLEITGAHAELFEHLRHESFAVAGQLLGGGLAGSIRALYTDPIPERDDLGNLVGSFGADDLEFALGYGHEVGTDVTVGGTAAVLHERIANLATTTYALGAGATWQPDVLQGAKLAVVAQNIGPAAHYTIDGVTGASVGLPAALQAGVSYATGLGDRFHVSGALEGRATRGRSAVGLIGGEIADASGAALRLGFRANDSTQGVSFGAGYAFAKLSLDYAFVPLRLDLGDTHRFAINARF